MSSHQAPPPEATEATPPAPGGDVGDRPAPSRADLPAAAGGGGPAAGAAAGGARRVTPVVVWACLGAFFVVLQVYVFASWILDGGLDVEKADVDHDPHLGMKFVGVLVPLSSLLTVVCLTVKFARDSRRLGRATFDLLMVGGLALCMWQDPLVNWMHPVVALNTNEFLVTGSWGPYVPGWQGAGPNQQAELPLPALVASLGALMMIMGVGAAMQWLAKRRPGVRPVPLMAFGLGVGFVLTAFSEAFFPLMGIFFWSRAIPELTLFSGHWFQFPLYEVLMAGIFFTSMAIVRYFVNERGETLVERGADRLAPARAVWVRFLAVAAVANVTYLTYMVGQILFSLAEGSPPDSLPDFMRPAAAW
ncbi:spirocyclase AveC family protein [Streptomyces sp. NPDC018031]|uniref:spirocyclase AveC family protein n=1 Tax=Streptomyces sp. NPDC018031 TaxID=3365033 RepID=UPI0037B11129